MEDQKLYHDVLYPDVLTQIAQCLKGMEDFGSFRLSCSLLRNATTMDDFNGLYLRRNVPYLMLPAKEDGSECEFFSLAKEKVVAKATLPEAKTKRWIESQGWLLTFGGYQEKGMSLLHPFEHLKIGLPNEEAFPEYGWLETKPYEFIQKMVLSSRPCESSDFAVVVIYGSCRYLGFWKPGNRNWTRIFTARTYKDILDVTYFDRQFFAINSAGEVWACDINGPNPTKAQFVVSLPCDGNRSYIVESSGMLLVVAWRPGRFHADEVTFEVTPGFDLFEVNTVMKTWEKINDLGGKALFIGHSASLLIEATRGIKADHIYYAGNAILLQDGGACNYNLREQRMEYLYRSNSDSPNCPVWVAPVF